MLSDLINQLSAIKLVGTTKRYADEVGVTQREADDKCLDSVKDAIKMLKLMEPRPAEQICNRDDTYENLALVFYKDGSVGTVYWPAVYTFSHRIKCWFPLSWIYDAIEEKK